MTTHNTTTHNTTHTTHDPAFLFSLRVRPYRDDAPIMIRAWEAGFQAPNHTRIDVEVRQAGRVIFERGVLYCATPGCVDDDAARSLVLSLVAMRPGDTDRDYFEGYSDAQLEWAQRYGEALSMVRFDRYGDD